MKTEKALLNIVILKDRKRKTYCRTTIGGRNKIEPLNFINKAKNNRGMEIIVLYPDYRGEGTRQGFYRRITSIVPDARIIPIFNGLPKEQLEELVLKAAEIGLESTFSDEPGLASALRKGYECCIQRYPAATVVRLDTAEHNPEYIPQLARSANETKGLVVGDLVFDGRQLVENSADELAHLDIFPALYSSFAKISISCAHGYQALDPAILTSVYDGARRIVETVENKGHQRVTWGFDGAMVLSAAKQNIPVLKMDVPALAVRNRDRTKIADQFSKALLMCRVAEEVFS